MKHLSCCESPKIASLSFPSNVPLKALLARAEEQLNIHQGEYQRALLKI